MDDERFSWRAVVGMKVYWRVNAIKPLTNIYEYIALFAFDWIRLYRLMAGNQPILTQSKKSLKRYRLNGSLSAL